MRRFTLGLVAVSLLASAPLGVRPAFAHGGQYRGPAGEVPPNSRKPEDPPPPDTNDGTPTPPETPGGTPTPPDGPDGTPTPPGGGGGDSPGDKPPPGGGTLPPVGGAGGGTTTGGKKPGKKGPSYESWLFWWNYNKDEIVNIKATLRAGAAASTHLGAGFSDSGSRHDAGSQDITQKAIETQVVPVLKRYARDFSVNFDIQSAAVLALAKVGREEEVPFIMSLAKNADGKAHKVVEESAALALGIMQKRSPEVRSFLSEVARDGSAKVRTRCFSMFALGLLGDDKGAYGSNTETLETLKALVASRESSRDIANSALVAMGLLGDRAAVPDLVRWLREEKAGTEKLGDLGLSYVAAALGRIGQPGVGGPDGREVFDALRARILAKSRLTRYSAIIAFGQIAPQGDENLQRECVEVLAQVAKGDKMFDQQAVNFALVGLGRIAGVRSAEDGPGGCPVAVRDRAIGELQKAFDDGRSRNFAALGLGLAAMHRDGTTRNGIAHGIRMALAREGSKGDIESRGALVMSLGMLQDRNAIPQLREILDTKGDARLRGAAAVALGLIGDRSTAVMESVGKALAEKDERELRVDAAIAAGLLNDKNAVKGLVEILREPARPSQFVLGSVAMALGQIGDERAVTPLKEILDDKDLPDLTRALTAVALGQIGDKTDVPVLNRVSRDVNYRAYFDAIGELLTII